MTDTPPVPPEIVRRAAEALIALDALWPDQYAHAAIAAVYGDIVAEKDAEIARLRTELADAEGRKWWAVIERDRAVAEARREALREAADAIRRDALGEWRDDGNLGVSWVDVAARIVADLADGTRS